MLSTDVGISAAAGVGSRPLGGVPHGLLDPGISVGVSAAELNLMADIQAHLQAAMTLRDLPPAPERTPPAQPQPISQPAEPSKPVSEEMADMQRQASGRIGGAAFVLIRSEARVVEPIRVHVDGAAGSNLEGASPRPASTLIRPTVVGTTQ